MEPVNFNKNPFEENGRKAVVEFPVTYDLKVILDADKEVEIQQRNLELVLEDAEVSFDFVKSKHSRKGNFVSLTMKITLHDKDQMGYLYHRLKLLPGIKFAV
ncbi:MAG: DUF493 domain-containing protein [Bacteroidales bacterium]|nr:DUF493 domain-containing protein [Bacteroidales bacterium]